MSHTCMGMCTYVYHSTCVEVREQLCRVISSTFTLCLSLFSVALINTMIESNLAGRGDFILAYSCS